MSSKWQFDEQFLIKTIKECKKLLRTNLTEEEKMAISKTLDNFLMYVNNKDDLNTCISVDNTLNLSIKKNEFMRNAINSFNSLGQDMISLIIYLDNSISFKDQRMRHKYSPYEEKVSIDNIVNNSFDVYRTYFPIFYDTAKKIVEYPVNLIHFAENSNIRSHCFGSSMYHLPFIYVNNYKSNPSVFIHELQHAVEYCTGFISNIYSGEIGSILMETLYIDEMLKQRNKNAALLYYDRIYEVENILENLSAYYKCVMEFRKNNFNVSNTKFINTLYNNNLICSKDDAIKYDISLDVDDCLNYLLSFFKSLEVRNKTYQDKKLAFQLLKKYLNYRNTINYYEDKMLLDYENYCNEISQKLKNYPRTKKYIKNKES